MTILECSQQKAKLVHSNGDWETTFQSPVSLHEGDQLIIRNSFIDTKKAPNTGEISVDEDTELVMTFGYYIYCWDMSDSSNNKLNKFWNTERQPRHAPKHDAFGKFYTAWNWDVSGTAFTYDPSCTPLTNTITIPIKKGNYAPDLLAKTITDFLSKLSLYELGNNISPFVPQHPLMISASMEPNIKDIQNRNGTPLHFWEVVENESITTPNKHLQNA